MTQTFELPLASERRFAPSYPVHPSGVPAGELVAGRYKLRFARSEKDLLDVQRLRFEVFNLELDEGLDSAFLLGRDEDEFDAYAHHLGQRLLHLQDRSGEGLVEFQASLLDRKSVV